MLHSVRNEDIQLHFENGFAETRVLNDVYPSVQVYRGVLKEGCNARPTVYHQAHQIFSFTGGTGYVTTRDKAYNITELSFFIANLDEPFKIHATTELVYTKFVVDLTDHDMKIYNTFHIVLPYFISISNAQEYWQSCKTPGTRSWTILATKRLNRCLMGVVESNSAGGTFEKGHPAVAQWNIILNDADMILDVEGEKTPQKPGDISYVEAGLDHCLSCDGKGKTHYIWFEHYVQEKDYIVTNPQRVDQHSDD
ncbi:MAG: hypothetical protein ABFD25_06055 [Clostridiaceae bacterium]